MDALKEKGVLVADVATGPGSALARRPADEGAAPVLLAAPPARTRSTPGEVSYPASRKRTSASCANEATRVPFAVSTSPRP